MGGEQQVNIKGVIGGLGAYILWGVLPIYWKLLSAFKPEVILTFRIVHACVFLGLIALFSKKLLPMLVIFKDKKKLLLVSTSSILITLNWFVYIWSVNHAYIVEASLGYFINPLISVAFGVFFLKERVTRSLIGSIFFILIGVGIMTISYGQIPWIALILAFSFASYGFVKKLTKLDGQTGLTLETILLALPAAGYLIYASLTTGLTVRTPTAGTLVLSLLAGIITAIPLLLFGYAAQKLSLGMLGFIQYISPTIQLAVGVLIYGESFTTRHIVTFSCIWIGIIIYSVPQFIAQHKLNMSKSVIDRA